MDAHGWARSPAKNRSRSGRGLVLAAGLCLLAGCGEETAAPVILDGAGVRVLLPPASGDWSEVTIELRHQNRVPPPTCGVPPPLAAAAGSSPDEDLCTRKSVEIRNLLGERVLYLPDVPYPRQGWDTRDDQGKLVPAGVYRTHEECLDSQGSHTFDGEYYVTDPEEEGSCEWILWSDTFDPGPEGRRIEIDPLPLAFAGEFQYHDDVLDRPYRALVTFDSPYLLVVRAPDGREVRREVNLVEGEFTEIRADFASAATTSEE